MPRVVIWWCHVSRSSGATYRDLTVCVSQSGGVMCRDLKVPCVVCRDLTVPCVVCCDLVVPCVAI